MNTSAFLSEISKEHVPVEVFLRSSELAPPILAMFSGSAKKQIRVSPLVYLWLAATSSERPFSSKSLSDQDNGHFQSSTLFASMSEHHDCSTAALIPLHHLECAFVEEVDPVRFLQTIRDCERC